MRRIIVDSGSSIKTEEKERYGVEILPIQLQIGEEFYLDGVNLDIDQFYEKLKEPGMFPKTALPSLAYVQELVDSYTEQGDEVLIITISSEISGTYQSFRMLFEEYSNVTIFDSRMAVGGIRFLVEEAKKYETEPMSVVVEKLNLLIPKIRIAAVPESLDYLLAGGRLSKAAWMVGKMLSIIPIVGFKEGHVSVLAKKRGLKQSKKHLIDMLTEDHCDTSYGIIASYTYNKNNIDEVVDMLSPKLRESIQAYDNLSPSIACHWGPNAFGFIYVSGDETAETI